MKTLRTLLLLLSGLAFVQAVAAQSYRLRAQDAISISVYDEPDLSSESQSVDGRGHVNIPLIGSVKISGLSLRDAETLIEKTFISKEILRAPQVTLTIREHVEQNITVLGEVKNPGPVVIPRQQAGLGIIDAISRAGGFSDVAKKKAVIVTRSKGTSKEQRFEINVYELMKGGAKANFTVKPGDIIFVDERLF